MLVAGIFLLLVGVGAILLAFVATDPDDRQGIPIAIWGMFVLMLGLILTIGFFIQNSPLKYSLKDYSYRVKIKSEVINGVETSRDTVYIFTPKKK